MVQEELMRKHCDDFPISFFVFRTYVAAFLFSIKYGSEFLIHMFKTFNKFSMAYLIQ